MSSAARDVEGCRRSVWRKVPPQRTTNTHYLFFIAVCLIVMNTAAMTYNLTVMSYNSAFIEEMIQDMRSSCPPLSIVNHDLPADVEFSSVSDVHFPGLGVTRVQI